MFDNVCLLDFDENYPEKIRTPEKRKKFTNEILKKLENTLLKEFDVWVNYTEFFLMVLSCLLSTKIIMYNSVAKIFQCYNRTKENKYIFLFYWNQAHYDFFLPKSSRKSLSKSAAAAIQRQRAENPAVSKRRVQYNRPKNLGKYGLTILCADEQNPDKWRQYINKNVVDLEKINYITEKDDKAFLIRNHGGSNHIIFIEDNCQNAIDVKEVVESLQPETLFVVKQKLIRAYEEMVEFKLTDHMEWADLELIKKILTKKAQEAQDEWTVYIKIKKSPQRESAASAPAKIPQSLSNAAAAAIQRKQLAAVSKRRQVKYERPENLGKSKIAPQVASASAPASSASAYPAFVEFPIDGTTSGYYDDLGNLRTINHYSSLVRHRNTQRHH